MQELMGDEGWGGGLVFFLMTPSVCDSYNIKHHKREISPKKKDVIAWMVFIKYPKSSGDDLLLQTSFSDHGDHIFLKRKATRTSPSWIDKNRRYP